MTEPIITRPRAGLLAFRQSDDLSAWSQAAQLIGIGVYLSGPDSVISEMESDGQELLIPQVELAPEAFDPENLPEYTLIGRQDEERFNAGVSVPPSPWWVETLQTQFWSQVHQTQSASAAFRLLSVSLYSPFEIVRVAAAAALAPLISRMWPQLESVLVDGCMAFDDTPRLLSAHALAKLNPEHPALAALIPESPGEGTPEPAHTSITIHGTFARLRSDWYRPESAFHRYLKSRVSNDLYSGDDYYRWDGRYSDTSRDLGAKDLSLWIKQHRVHALDTIFAHSHGGNLALTALENGVRTRLLVLMSVPALQRSDQEWAIIFANVGRVVSLRSKFDLVIYADRSCQRFDAKVRQLLPPRLWFSHGAILKPKTWERHRLPNEIAYERGLARVP